MKTRSIWFRAVSCLCAPAKCSRIHFSFISLSHTHAHPMWGEKLTTHIITACTHKFNIHTSLGTEIPWRITRHSPFQCNWNIRNMINLIWVKWNPYLNQIRIVSLHQINQINTFEWWCQYFYRNNKNETLSKCFI